MLPVTIRTPFTRALGVWNPFRDEDRFETDFNRVFNSFWHRGVDDPAVVKGWLPSVDLYEEKGKVVVRAELPGIKKEDITLTLTEDTLTLQAERKQENEVKNERYHVREGSYGTFHRVLALPADVKAEKATADYKDGILTIHLPKTEETKARKIKIEGN